MHNAGAKSAHELYEKELNARKIITFCGDLDGMLGGGVATGQITEFCKHFLTASQEHAGQALLLAKLNANASATQVVSQRWGRRNWGEAAGQTLQKCLALRAACLLCYNNASLPSFYLHSQLLTIHMPPQDTACG